MCSCSREGCEWGCSSCVCVLAASCPATSCNMRLAAEIVPAFIGANFSVLFLYIRVHEAAIACVAPYDSEPGLQRMRMTRPNPYPAHAILQEGENLTALLVWIDKEPLKGSVLFVVRPLRSGPHCTTTRGVCEVQCTSTWPQKLPLLSYAVDMMSSWSQQWSPWPSWHVVTWQRAHLPPAGAGCAGDYCAVPRRGVRACGRRDLQPCAGDRARVAGHVARPDAGVHGRAVRSPR